MTETINLRVTPEIAYNQLRLLAEISTNLHIDVNRIKSLHIAKRSIDARQRKVMVQLTLVVGIDQPAEKAELKQIAYPDVNHAQQVIVVGAGPAGLFAALKLIELGLKPIVLERGKSVDERGRDMAAIARQNLVNPESNYCFGEGGAGAYSDGKLYTRSKKRGSVDEILQIFVNHGASEEILIDAHPHIGTDRLPKVIKAIRETIINSGGEVHFSTKVTDLIIEDRPTADGVQKTVAGVITADGQQILGPVILATGHSARDIYQMLVNRQIDVEPKGLAIGVRLEHPQPIIDQIQYHSPSGRGKWLPPAEYSMLTRVDNRAVYSFCMCPGGTIIPAATGPEQIVVNGMSPASRGGKWANSGMVVEILPEDVTGDDPLKMMHYQADIERAFYNEANGSQNAPAQRMTDFVAGVASTSLPPTSYAPGIHPARIDQLLPKPIAQRLQKGFAEFGRKQKGFLTKQATLIGAETRTSAPVRIIRDNDSLCHKHVAGLYPAGEGAGYAGGIVSAAIDGQRVAMAVADMIRSNT